MPRFFLAAFILGSVLSLWLCARVLIPHEGHPQPELSTVKLLVDGHEVQTEVASTAQEQERGLMFRKSLPANYGMLFIFDKAQPLCFWMHNTLLPLSIAFMNDDGIIISIQDMAPETDIGHCSGKPARYALEMPQGWFDAHNVTFGSNAAVSSIGTEIHQRRDDDAFHVLRSLF